MRRPPINECTQQSNKLNADAMGEGWERTCDRRGTQGEHYLIIMGTVELGGGRK